MFLGKRKWKTRPYNQVNTRKRHSGSDQSLPEEFQVQLGTE
uniref:Uncharacterized protein n=1 Tax=Arundo donax TaxID=35708 RepID=A0A0A8Z577_ARUDO